MTADLARLNGVVARLTNGNVSIEERRDALGPDWADFMRAPFKVRPRPRLPQAAPGRRAARGSLATRAIIVRRRRRWGEEGRKGHPPSGVAVGAGEGAARGAGVHWARGGGGGVLDRAGGGARARRRGARDAPRARAQPAADAGAVRAPPARSPRRSRRHHPHKVPALRAPPPRAGTRGHAR